MSNNSIGTKKGSADLVEKKSSNPTPGNSGQRLVPGKSSFSDLGGVSHHDLFAALTTADKEEMKAQIIATSPFGEALKAQEGVEESGLGLKQRYLSKKGEGEITREHEQYNLTYAMMIGIRHSVQSWAVNSPQSLSGSPKHRTLQRVAVKDMKLGVKDTHFFNAYKMVFPPEGGSPFSKNPLDHTPKHLLKGTFKFKDYAPEVFGRLRQRFEIDDKEYMDSLCGSFNYLEFISNSKSGEFFFYSHDGKFMIKTQSGRESKFMLRLLPSYFNYVADHPNSLLVRICGAHRVKMPHLRRRMHFVIMMSVFSDATEAKPVNRIYDLKGATLGRHAGAKESVKKDLDILADGTKLYLGAKRDQFLTQVEDDSMFLVTMGVMDYSLLVGIHEGSTSSPRSEHKSLNQATSFVFRSARKSNMGIMLSTGQQLALVDAPPQDTGGAIPSLPDMFGKHQVRSSFDMPSITETSSHKHVSMDKKLLNTVAEVTSLRVGNATNSAPLGIGRADSRELTRGTTMGEFNSFYKIESTSTSAGTIYHMGVIDIFTRYGISKRGEHFFKALRGNGATISATNPKAYRKRFIKFISKLVVAD